MADSERVASTVLDRLVPTFQAAERHSATIAASAEQVWAALTQVTTGELRLFRRLMGVRVLPGRLLGSPRARFDVDEPLLAWAVRFGFPILGQEARRELVVGAIGQPWRLTGGRSVTVVDGNGFAAFDQAGYAKMAVNFRLDPRRRRQGHPAQHRDPGSLHRCHFGAPFRLVLAANLPRERRDPSQLAGGDQAPRRTTRERRSRPGVGASTAAIVCRDLATMGIKRRQLERREVRPSPGAARSHDTPLTIPRPLRRRVPWHPLQVLWCRPWPSPLECRLGSLLAARAGIPNDAAGFA
jgi:hypothetical protein